MDTGPDGVIAADPFDRKGAVGRRQSAPAFCQGQIVEAEAYKVVFYAGDAKNISVKAMQDMGSKPMIAAGIIPGIFP